MDMGAFSLVFRCRSGIHYYTLEVHCVYLSIGSWDLSYHQRSHGICPRGVASAVDRVVMDLDMLPFWATRTNPFYGFLRKRVDFPLENRKDGMGFVRGFFDCLVGLDWI